MKWIHNDYSEEALFEMQQEAEKRVREMQSRSRLLVEPPAPPAMPDIPSFLSSGPKPKIPPPTPPSPAVFPDLSYFLKGDRPILLALFWLLWNEHADVNLLLALVYLLL